MPVDLYSVDLVESMLDPETRTRTLRAAESVAAAKERGQKVAVVTGSGPNLHEGVTTLLAELMRAGVIDAITTSSAAVAHEMGGTLDRVKRCDGRAVGVDPARLPRGGEFELTEVDDATLDAMARQVPVDFDLIARLRAAEGKTIIKAAGNLGYPMGLWLEHLSGIIARQAREQGAPFEEVAGRAADPRTMIGAGAQLGLPVLVTIPQLVGGGLVGLNIADSITVTERAERLARMLDSAEVIIESGLALAQEIHDGPFELYTGHGLWSAWEGRFTYSLEDKTLIRIDLDPNLDLVCQMEREGSAVQKAIAEGLPKSKLFKTPFRMEMSGFARHPNSQAVIGDLGIVWPVLARHVARRLGLTLEFMSYPQQTEPGRAMREWIVKEVRPLRWE
jgi:hypothetical protein